MRKVSCACVAIYPQCVCIYTVITIQASPQWCTVRSMTATVLADNGLDGFGTGCLTSHSTKWGGPVNGHKLCTGWYGTYPATENAQPSKVIHDVAPKFSDANDPKKHPTIKIKNHFSEKTSLKETMDKRRGSNPAAKARNVRLDDVPSVPPTTTNNSAGFTRSWTWSQRAHQQDPAWSFSGWVICFRKKQRWKLGQIPIKKGKR